MGAHVEIVYLVVTNTNDSEECYSWIIDNHLKYLGTSVPFHINRYYPAHRWVEPPTPLKKLLEIREVAVKSGIEYVYVGNIGNPRYETTYCSKCGKVLIERANYRVTHFSLVRDQGGYRHPRCGHRVPLVGRYVPKGFT